VQGVVLELPGRVQQHSLRDPKTREIDKSHVTLSFRPEPRTYPLRPANSEATLATLLATINPLELPVLRIRLPRIMHNGVYIPTSERVARTLAAITKVQEASQITDLAPYLRMCPVIARRPVGVDRVEGHDGPARDT
jgi:hypothetical protein